MGLTGMKVSPKMSVPRTSLALPLSQPPTEHEEEVVSQDCAPTAKSTGPCSNSGRGGGGPTRAAGSGRLSPVCGVIFMILASLLLIESVLAQSIPPCP
jgi:hypothetical protein